MEPLKRMNKHHQNPRMFIRDWTGNSTNQLKEKDEGVVGERMKQRREGKREGVWPEYGQ